MARYLLSIQQPDGPPPPAVDLEQIMRDVAAVEADLRAAGAWVLGGGLHPAAAAAVVRTHDGEPLTTDGPYAETKEHLGGITVIDADDAEAALAWAGRLAQATTLPIEVREFQA